MPQFYSVQEVCYGCQSLIRADIDLYSRAWACYLLPSGSQIFKNSFEVPSWCDDCLEFRLAYHPIDLENILLQRGDAFLKLNNMKGDLSYKILRRFFGKKKLQFERLQQIIEKCDNIFEFSSCRNNYNTPHCLKCGSKNVDTRWTDKDNNLLRARLETGRVHECGSEIFYAVTRGRYSPARGLKAVKYDCNDNVIE